MPTYYSKRTTVQLSLVDLEKTATAFPNIAAGSDRERVFSINATEFAQGSVSGTLKELPVSTEDAHSNMSYLGLNQNMPFFMVHAGVDLYDQTRDKTHIRRPERVPQVEGTAPFISHSLACSVSGSTLLGNPKAHMADPEFESQGDRRSRRPKHLKPHGLCLTVFLTPDSFLPMHEEGSTNVAFSDVKIDVFFNGELCGSSFVAERHHGNEHQMTEHIVRFSGRKIGNMVEKPWVIVPPGQNADGTLRKHHQGEKAYAGAQPRWAALSEALEAEAGRVGCDELGELSLLGEYLITLAKREMPPEVEEMQNAEGAQFGVIDVVVISGKRQEDDATKGKVMHRPTAMRLKANKTEVRKYWTNPPKDYYGRNTIPQMMSIEDVRAMEIRHALLKSKIVSYGRKLQYSHNTVVPSTAPQTQPITSASASSPPGPSQQSSEPVAGKLTTRGKLERRSLNLNNSLETPIAWDESWSTPPLSQDSVLTYAKDGILRLVKPEQSGWFEEKDVVMGARFLVGCK